MLKVLVSVLVLAACAAAYFQLAWVMDQPRYLGVDSLDKIVIFNGEGMPARDVLLQKFTAAPWYLRFLLRRSVSDLRAMLFIILGIVGWCGSIWVQQGAVTSRFIPSLLAAALFGWISCLLINLLNQPLSAVLDRPYSRLEILPVLAGLLSSRFYLSLTGILVTMMDGFKAIIKKILGAPAKAGGTGILLIGAVLASGGIWTPDAAAQGAKLYLCTDPKKDPPCIADSEENKAKCKYTCNLWVKQELTRDWYAANVLTSGTDANAALAASASKLYGFSITRQNNGKVPTMDEVWEDPAKYGLSEVDPKDAKPGTLVVLPHISGIVTTAAPDEGNTEVLYPSQKLGGKANETALKNLSGDAQPKFVAPANMATGGKK
jgi:hypothetical protein